MLHLAKPIKDKTGKKYSRLTVVSLAGRKNGRTYWHVKCDCGKKKAVRGDKLETGQIKSCGCLMVEKRESNLMYHNLTPGMRGWHFSKRYE